MLTLCIGPVGVQVGQGGLVADLLEGLGRLMVDLEDAARSPPAATVVAVAHCGVEVGASTARRLRARVVGDGAREEDWRRQLGGIVGGTPGRERRVLREGVRERLQRMAVKRNFGRGVGGDTEQLR